MHVDTPDVLNRGGSHTLRASRANAGRPERVRGDHMNLVAVGRKLLGEVLDQNRGAVDRREIGLRDEDDPTTVSHVWFLALRSLRA
jgi:hypothetical protein